MEINDGYLTGKTTYRFLHDLAQGARLGVLHPTFHRCGGAVPGGWWLAPEVDVELEPGNVYCPNIAGWRRERMSSPPAGHPLSLRPDWGSRCRSSVGAWTGSRALTAKSCPARFQVGPEGR